MKTLEDLFQLVAMAVSRNRNHYRTLFVDFQGHVNQIAFRYYLTGWTVETDGYGDRVDFTLNEDGIQAAYWWLKANVLSL